MLPSPIIHCDLPKTRRYPFDVPGTANISYGHKLAGHADRRVAKHHVNSGRSILECAEEQPEDKRDYEQVLKIVEFEKETDRKIKSKILRQRAQQGVSAYEESLRTRRERLCDLVVNEESSLTRELAEEARRAEDAQFEEMRVTTEELRKQQEQARKALVAAKRTQQYLASCQTVQQKYSRGCTINVKRSNVAQIADNEAKRSAEKELEELWHRAMQRQLETERLKETRESTKRASAQREVACTLAKQVAEKKSALEQERRLLQKSELEQLEQLQEELRLAESRDLQLRQQKREQLKRDIEEDILVAGQRHAERAREEAAANRASAEGEIIKERLTKNPATLRTESMAYAGYLEDLRRDEARREREVEAAIERSREDAEARCDLTRRKLKEARERSLQEVLRGREEQVRARRDAEAAERRLKMQEREVLERQIESDANLAAMKRRESRQKAYRYGLELKEQQEQRRQRLGEEERRRELEEVKRQTDEEDRMRLVQETWSASGKITRNPLRAPSCSPFKERHAAHASEGHCCCPQVLSPA
ncbi:trichohyalin-like [Odontomachus brunneus]|uniref:trichohyalin-like n=1 Tax=Odontomachus brunneus TaxID=486640 RepID=UPI0013F1F730|nr:trichohyalin-like [Odontomachus brunneus]